MLTADEDPAPTSSQLEAIEVIQKLRERGFGIILDALGDSRSTTKGGRINKSGICRLLSTQNCDVQEELDKLQGATAELMGDRARKASMRAHQFQKIIRTSQPPATMSRTGVEMKALGFYSITSLAAECGLTPASLMVFIKAHGLAKPVHRLSQYPFPVYRADEGTQIKKAFDQVRIAFELKKLDDPAK